MNSLLATSGPLSFPVVAAALQAGHVPEDDVPRVLGALLAAGATLPPALAALASPPERTGPSRVPSAAVRPLSGDETLDLSQISIADLEP